jgi:hypothetical protein
VWPSSAQTNHECIVHICCVHGGLCPSTVHTCLQSQVIKAHNCVTNPWQIHTFIPLHITTNPPTTHHYTHNTPTWGPSKALPCHVSNTLPSGPKQQGKPWGPKIGKPCWSSATGAPQPLVNGTPFGHSRTCRGCDGVEISTSGGAGCVCTGAQADP